MNESNQEGQSLEQPLFVRAVPPQYIKLIERARLVLAPSSEYSRLLLHSLEDVKFSKLLQDKIENETVLDLGCGQSHWISVLARKLRAQKYIGVDLNPQSLHQEIFTNSPSDIIPTLAPPPKDTPVVNNSPQTKYSESSRYVEPIIEGESDDFNLIISSDMLNAISRMKNSSVGVVVLSGIEGSDFVINDEYFTALAIEIERILISKGIVVCYVTDLFPRGLKKLVSIEDGKGAIYEKD